MPDDTVLNHLGPFTDQLPVKAICDLTQRAWDMYHAELGGQKRSNETHRQHLASRMMYITEVMSRGVRVNASWGLTHAAMSLLRDRYEQAVRFSWLAKQTDGKEFEKYLLHFYDKTRKLIKNISPEQRAKFAEIMGPLQPWVLEDVTPEQKAKLKQWEDLDLRSMAKKRDALPPLTDLPVGKETLAQWYDAIYAQFSSVSHFDMYGIEMIKIHRTQRGENIMAPNAYWPGILIVQNCYFDVIQCFEAAHAYYNVDISKQSTQLLGDWIKITKHMNLEPENLASSSTL